MRSAFSHQRDLDAAKTRSMSEGRSHLGQQTFYEIRVRGHLDDRWSDWLGGLAVQRQEDGTTLLAGAVVDQSALYGVIIRIRDLGLPLLSVKLCEEPHGST